MREACDQHDFMAEIAGCCRDLALLVNWNVIKNLAAQSHKRLPLFTCSSWSNRTGFSGPVMLSPSRSRFKAWQSLRPQRLYLRHKQNLSGHFSAPTACQAPSPLSQPRTQRGCPRATRPPQKQTVTDSRRGSYQASEVQIYQADVSGGLAVRLVSSEEPFRERKASWGLLSRKAKVKSWFPGLTARSGIFNQLLEYKSIQTATSIDNTPAAQIMPSISCQLLLCCLWREQPKISFTKLSISHDDIEEDGSHELALR